MDFLLLLQVKHLSQMLTVVADFILMLFKPFKNEELQGFLKFNRLIVAVKLQQMFQYLSLTQVQ